MSGKVSESRSRQVKTPTSQGDRESEGDLFDPELDDLRFRRLLSGDDWARLPAGIRRRFSKRLAGGATAIYVGRIIKARFSRLGRFLAQAARLIGGPLPTSRDIDVPSIVSVTEDATTGGQTWTRIYTRRDGFPQVIHSSKRFAGPTGLEEYVGFGVCMALNVIVEDRSLCFRSAGYFLQLGRLRIRLPDWATPGRLTVRHCDLGDGEFLFMLAIDHPRFGPLIEQSGVFREATP